MRKIDKVIIYSIFYTPAFLLLCYFVWNSIFGKSVDELVKEDDLSEAFSGRVDSLYVEKQNHGVNVALLSNGYKYYIIQRWVSKIQVGDSLSKKQGAFLLNVYKKGGEVITLDYRNTYKK